MEVDDSEDDRPLSSRIQVKKNYDSDSEDDKPLVISISYDLVTMVTLKKSP